VAVHAVAEGHETLWGETIPPPGLGIAWIVQRVPFQRSAQGAVAMLEIVM
jgi:hypothetical protein